VLPTWITTDIVTVLAIFIVAYLESKIGALEHDAKTMQNEFRRHEEALDDLRALFADVDDCVFALKKQISQ
jgi:hypothetical protein